MTREELNAKYPWMADTELFQHATLMVCVRRDGSDSSIIMRFDADTLEQMAEDCTEAARIIRRIEDAKLNSEIAELDVKYPKVA